MAHRYFLSHRRHISVFSPPWFVSMIRSLPAQQNSLFYDFCPEQHISENHLLHHIDRFVDFDRIGEHLEPFYSHTGRPDLRRKEQATPTPPSRALAQGS